MVVKIFFGVVMTGGGVGVGFTGAWCEKNYNLGIEFWVLGMI